MLMNYGTPPLGFVVIGESPIRGSLYYSSVEGGAPMTFARHHLPSSLEPRRPPRLTPCVSCAPR